MCIQLRFNCVAVGWPFWNEIVLLVIICANIANFIGLSIVSSVCTQIFNKELNSYSEPSDILVFEMILFSTISAFFTCLIRKEPFEIIARLLLHPVKDPASDPHMSSDWCFSDTLVPVLYRILSALIKAKKDYIASISNDLKEQMCQKEVAIYICE